MKGFLEARVKGVPALMPGRVEAHLAHLFATEKGEDGDGARSQQRRCMPSFWPFIGGWLVLL